MRLLWRLKTRNKIMQEVLVTILFGRCLSAFQSAVLHAERGMILEGRYGLRAMLETTFALVANAKGEGFADRYLHDDFHRHVQLVDACLRMTPEGKKFHKLDTDDLRTIRAASQKEIDKAKSKPLKVWQTAKAAGMQDHYNTAYGLLSNTAHASVRDLDYHVIPTDDGQDIKKFGFGPRPEKSDDLLMQACDYLLIGAYALLDVFEHPEFQRAYSAHHRRFVLLLDRMGMPSKPEAKGS
jgi:hypothetical protein